MRVLVTGACGQLGMSLRPVLPEATVYTDVTPEARYLDITDIEAIRSLVAREKVDCIVNCAAYTNVDAAEDHPETAELAVAAGAKLINCVYPEPVPAMLEILRRSPEDVELVVPASCLGKDVFSADLGRIFLDPMIGFGTTREEDLALLASVSALSEKGRVLVGASRKRIVRVLAGESGTDSLLGGDVAVALWAAANGASAVRVHDVKEVAQALRVWSRLAKARNAKEV